MFIIAGLGNPTKEYEHTRHNVGFDTIDIIAEKYHIGMGEKKHKAIIGKGHIEGQKVILVKPQTFMNLSGESIREIVDYYKIDEESELIVIYDDISNIIAQLGTQNFCRIKVGVGEKPKGWDLADYVLGHFNSEETKLMQEAFAAAAEATAVILTEDIDAAMNRYN